MNVHITFDVETRRSVGGKPEDLIAGLGSDGRYGPVEVATELSSRGRTGTFFIDVLWESTGGSRFWPEFGQSILEAGGDLGLHTHGEWIQTGVRGLSRCSEAESIRILQSAVDRFESLLSRRPVVHRAGWLDMPYSLFGQLTSVGIRVDCSVGHASSSPLREYFLPNTVQALGNVCVVPLTTYDYFSLGRLRRRRHLDIVNSSTREVRCLLEQLAASGASHAVSLSHSFDFLMPDAGPGWRLDRHAIDRFRRNLDVIDAMRSGHSCDLATVTPPEPGVPFVGVPSLGPLASLAAVTMRLRERRRRAI